MQTEENLVYFNWLFTWDVNKVYYNLINCEIEKAPYKDREDGDLFWVNKRKWYIGKAWVDYWQMVGVFIPASFYLTDVIEIWIYKYLMAVDYQADIIKIFKEIQIPGWRPVLVEIYSWAYGGNDKFTKTKFVWGKPRTLFVASWDITSIIGIEENNTNTMLSYFRDWTQIDWNYANWWDSVNPWDYIYCYDNKSLFELWVSGIPGSVAKVNYRDVTSPEKLNTTGRPGFAGSQLEGKDMKYYIFPEITEVFLFSTKNWVVCWHYDDYTTTPGSVAIFTNVWQSTEAFSSMVEHNGFLAYYYDKWGIISYGGQGTDQMYWFATQYIPISKDILNITSFGNYLVAMAKDSIVACTITTITDTTVTPASIEYVWGSQNVMQWEGLFSDSSYDVTEEWLFMITNQKRFGNLSLSSPGAYYGNQNIESKFNDMSEWIKWHLDLIQDDDDVWVKIDNREIRIFINWTTYNSPLYNKTKILIYDRLYKIRHVHISLNTVINGYENWYFLGNRPYEYCGRKDWYYIIIYWEELNKLIFKEFDYDQKIQMYFWETTDAAQIHTYKKLHFAKLLLWFNTKAHNNTTIFTLESYRYWYKPVFQINNIEDVRYVAMINAIEEHELFEPSDCEVSLLQECSNFIYPCEWSWADLEEDLCWNRIRTEDYWICIDDNKYFLSPFVNVYIPLNLDRFAELYRITIEAKWEDRLETWGMLIWFETQLPSRQTPDTGNTWTCPKCSTDIIPCETACQPN